MTLEDEDDRTYTSELSLPRETPLGYNYPVAELKYSTMPLRVLYIGLQYDYGVQERGYSYEYINFVGALQHMKGIDVTVFAFDEIMRKVGREKMNNALLTVVQDQKPDVCFFVLFTDEISKETIRMISERSSAKTLNWFCDDHWRFHSYSKHWAPLFHWVVTTDPKAVQEYSRAGIRNVICSQWGFNHFLLVDQPFIGDLDVSFVGQVHSTRKSIVAQLAHAGIEVNCWGKGWKNGLLTHDEMVRTFLRSKINLNFADSSVMFGVRPFAKIFLNRRSDNTFHMNSVAQMIYGAHSIVARRRAQIKARNFEIPGYGGLLLTPEISGLEQYYVVGKEVASYNSFEELGDKISYYLTHDAEREQLRLAGQRRTLNDHTYEQRFGQIFASMSLI